MTERNDDLRSCATVDLASTSSEKRVVEELGKIRASAGGASKQVAMSSKKVMMSSSPAVGEEGCSKSKQRQASKAKQERVDELETYFLELTHRCQPDHGLGNHWPIGETASEPTSTTPVKEPALLVPFHTSVGVTSSVGCDELW